MPAPDRRAVDAEAERRNLESDCLGVDGPTIRRWHVLSCEPFSIGGREIAGVIGMDLLQSFRMTLSHSAGARRLTLLPNFEEPRERIGKAVAIEGAGWDVPLDYSPAGPLVLSTLDGEARSLILDLGSARSAIFVRPSEFDAKVKAPSVRQWQSFEVEGDLSRAEWKKTEVRAGDVVIADLNLMGAHLPHRTLLALDHPLSTDLLGMDFLDGFGKAEFDFRRRSLRLTNLGSDPN